MPVNVPLGEEQLPVPVPPSPFVHPVLRFVETQNLRPLVPRGRDSLDLTQMQPSEMVKH